MHSIELSKSLIEAANRYADQVNEETLAYLNGRGISEEVAGLYSLGTVTDPIPGHEMHVGWLSIPYITAGGHCVGFKFRRLDDGKPKYGSPMGQKAHLYNVPDITKHSSAIVVCEGELDTIVVSGVLHMPAVGVPGVQAFKPHFAKLLGGYQTVFICGDNDVKEDGSNPGYEFAKRLSGEIYNSQIVSLPPNMDINDYYIQNGYDATRHLLGGKAVIERDSSFPF